MTVANILDAQLEASTDWLLVKEGALTGLSEMLCDAQSMASGPRRTERIEAIQRATARVVKWRAEKGPRGF